MSLRKLPNVMELDTMKTVAEFIGGAFSLVR